MVVVELRPKDKEKSYFVRMCEAGDLGWFFNGKYRLLCASLERENNRGWSFVSYGLTGKGVKIFVPRGEFERVEIEREAWSLPDEYQLR